MFGALTSDPRMRQPEKVHDILNNRRAWKTGDGSKVHDILINRRAWKTGDGSSTLSMQTVAIGDKKKQEKQKTYAKGTQKKTAKKATYSRRVRVMLQPRSL